MAKLHIKWVRSSIGCPKDQRATIRALGLRKLQQTVVHEDHPTIRGMIFKVKHLVQVLPSTSPEPQASRESGVGEMVSKREREETSRETV